MLSRDDLRSIVFKEIVGRDCQIVATAHDVADAIAALLELRLSAEADPVTDRPRNERSDTATSQRDD